MIYFGRKQTQANEKERLIMTTKKQWTNEQLHCFNEWKVLQTKVKALQELSAMISEDIAEAQGYYLQNKNEYDKGYIHGMQEIREGAMKRLMLNLQDKITEKVEEFGSMKMGK